MSTPDENTENLESLLQKRLLEIQGPISQNSGRVEQTYGDKHQQIRGPYIEQLHLHVSPLLNEDMEEVLKVLISLGGEAVLKLLQETEGKAVLEGADGITLQQRILQEMRARSSRMQHAQQLLTRARDIAWSESLLKKAFRAVAQRACPLATSPADLFDVCVTELAYNTFESPVDPLIVFVRLLATALQQPEAGVILNAWLDEVDENSTLVPTQTLQHFQSLHSRNPALMIAIKSLPNNMYEVYAWVWHGDGTSDPFQEDDGTHSLIYAEHDLEDVFEKRYEWALETITEGFAQLTIEFFLPLKQLTKCVHEWEVVAGVEEKRTSIGIEYAVMIRSFERALERRRKTERDRWRRKWRSIDSASPDCSPYFKPCAADYTDRDLLKTRLNDEHILCYVEMLAPPIGVNYCVDVLAQVLNAGVPIGLWIDTDANRSAEAYQQMEYLVTSEHLTLLPARVREEWRLRYAHLRHSLIFFYDDPDRMPYDPDAAARPFVPLRGST